MHGCVVPYTHLSLFLPFAAGRIRGEKGELPLSFSLSLSDFPGGPDGGRGNGPCYGFDGRAEGNGNMKRTRQ